MSLQSTFTGAVAVPRMDRVTALLLGATTALVLLPELGLRRALGPSRTSVLFCWFGWSAWSVLPTILTGAATWDSRALAGAAAPLVLSALAGAVLPARALWETPVNLISSAG